ncbi:MAG: hypothetical protein ACYC3B_08185 [Sedimentisphaerales bacterium]
MKKFFRNLSIFAAAVCVLAFSIGWTARHNINLGEFIKEITAINVKGNQTQSAIWLPFEFNARAAGGQSADDVSILKSYLIFMVQCTTDAGSSQTQEQIKTRAILKNTSSAILRPLAAIPAELSPRLNAIKTAMAADKNMYFLVFDSKDASGKDIIESSKREKLTLVLQPAGLFDRTEFVWRTPFDATTDAGVCPKCSEKIKAMWNYCPWCGTAMTK